MSQLPTMFTHSPSDKVQVLGAGELPAPGACAICGAGDPERKYAFFGVHVDFLGAILICDFCLVQAAEKIGCLAPSVAEMVHVQSVQLANENAELKTKVAAQDERLAVFDDALSRISIDTTASGISLSSSISKADAGELPAAEESVHDSAEVESESVESVEGDGTPTVSKLESNDLTAEPRNEGKSATPNI